MRKKFLFVVNNPIYFVYHRLPIAVELQEQGHEVHLAGPGDQLEEIEKAGVIFQQLKVSRRGMNPFLELFTVLRFYKLFRSLKPDVVHFVTMKPNLYGGIAARLAGLDAVVNAISGLGNLFTGQSFKHRLLRFFLRPLFTFALSHPNQRVIFQNSSDENEMVEKGMVERSKCVLIPGSGVKLDDYPVLERAGARSVVVTFAARLLRDKGVFEFVQASRLLKKDYPDVTFQLVGGRDPGNPESVSESDVQEWKVQGDVEVLGHRNDIPTVFAHSDIVVLPSYREGLPKILLEAQACARAVVTTDVPGCRDAILKDQTGLLVPVRAVEPLKDAIERLIKDSELRVQMGKRGRQLCEEKFSIEKIVALHLETYQMISDLTSKPQS